MTPNKNIYRIFIVTGLILLIPLIAMQFSDEWDWKPADFIIIGTLLISAGLAYELIARNLKDNLHKTIVGFAIVVLVLLIWAELAVGVFGTPFAGS